MARAAQTGLVVDVRYPPLFPRERSVARHWSSVRVDVGEASRHFNLAGDRRLPFAVRLAPGTHRVTVVNENLERLTEEIEVEPAGVTVVAVRPQYVWIVYRTRPRIEVVEIIRT